MSASQVQLKLDHATEEAMKWQSRCREVEATVLHLTELLREHLRRQDSTPPQAGRSSEEAPTRLGSEFVNTGRQFSVLSTRQQSRKLSQVSTAVEKALWFVESFGLAVESVTVKTPSEGKSIKLPMHSKSTTDVNDDSVRQSLYLLERFGVSDEFYHELSIEG